MHAPHFAASDPSRKSNSMNVTGERKKAVTHQDKWRKHAGLLILLVDFRSVTYYVKESKLWYLKAKTGHIAAYCG